MKITILYDNETYKSGLTSDWGFSCLVEAEGTPKILFDTGAKGKILLQNMKKLEIEPTSIDEIFISHSHYDHAGGLKEILKENEDVKLLLPYPPSKSGPQNITTIKKPKEIHEDVFSTGAIQNKEQSLIFRSEKGLVVIVGCSHPGVGTILEKASKFGKPHALVGGLHSFSEFSLLESLSLVCPAHCTQHKSQIKSKFPKKSVEDGAGRIIRI